MTADMSPSSSSPRSPATSILPTAQRSDGKRFAQGAAVRQRHGSSAAYGGSGAAIEGDCSPTSDGVALTNTSLTAATRSPHHGLGAAAAAEAAADAMVQQSAAATSSSASSTSSAAAVAASMAIPSGHFPYATIQSSTPTTSTYESGSHFGTLSTAYTHSAPPTMTSFSSQQQIAPAHQHLSSHYAAPHEYSAYGHASPQHLYPQQQQQQQNLPPSPVSSFGTQHISPPPMYGPMDSHSPGEGRTSQSLGGSAASSPTTYSMPQHYYQSAFPTQMDDLRPSQYGSASSAGLSRGGASRHPYYVPSQPQRSPLFTTSIGGSSGSGAHPLGSSIITANPDSLPDLRYGEGASAAASGGLYHPVNYGRLPNGKIIELYPAMMRTIQACEYCRSRKAKCSGGLPCDRCKKKNMKCEYAQLDKKRKIKTTTSEMDLSSGAAGTSSSSMHPQPQTATIGPGMELSSTSGGSGGGAADTGRAQARAVTWDAANAYLGSPAHHHTDYEQALHASSSSSSSIGVYSGSRAGGSGSRSEQLPQGEWCQPHAPVQYSADAFSETRGTLSARRNSRAYLHALDASSLAATFIPPASLSIIPPSPRSFCDLLSPLSALDMAVGADADGGDRSPSASLRPSPALSQDSFMTAKSHEHVMPDALWYDAAFVSPSIDEQEAKMFADSDDLIQRLDWLSYE